MINDSLIIDKSSNKVYLTDANNGISYTFNRTGAAIIDYLLQGDDCSLIAEKLCSKYPRVSIPQISSDVSSFVSLLKRLGFFRAVGDVPYDFNWLCWDVTYNCNLACKHCFLGGLTNAGVEDSNRLLPIWHKLQGATIRLIEFSGGEPFLHPTFPKLLELTHLQNQPVIIKTNGTLIDQAMAETVSKMGNIILVSVSLDGPSPDIHDTMRSPGAFAKAVKGIEYLVKYGLNVQIAFTVTDFNYPYLEHTVNLAGQLGVHSFYPGLVFSQGKALENSLTFTQYKDYFIHIDEIAEKYRGIVKINSYSDTYDLFRKGKFKKEGCSITRGNVLIDPAGNIYPCRRFSGMEAYWMGNILDDGFEIDRLRKNSRKFSAFTVDHLPHCAPCKIKYLCGGLCRRNSVVHTGDWFGRDPDCPDYRSAWEEFISRKEHATLADGCPLMP